VLAVAMGMIPLIGGVLEESGQMDSLINNLRLGKRNLLAVIPALFGLLPMPGGAILSCPLVERIYPEGTGIHKSVVNVWFRHLLILIYPISPALIVSCKIVGLEVYRAIIFLLPWAIYSFILGYVFFLRKVKGEMTYKMRFSLKELAIPLLVILLAPIINFCLQKFVNLRPANLSTFLGVSMSLLVGILLSKTKINLSQIAIKMRTWNFALIIFGMFLFVNVFKSSPVASLFADLPITREMLGLAGGFILGFFTGRVQLPASIILPIYLVRFGNISPFNFSLIYVSIFFGYMISPVHPCACVSVAYFGTKLKNFLKVMSSPTIILIITIYLVFKFIL